MPSERVQRQIDRLLDEAEAALGTGDWAAVRLRAEAVLRLDPENGDAQTYLAAAGPAAGVPRPEDRGMETGQASPADESLGLEGISSSLSPRDRRVAAETRAGPQGRPGDVREKAPPPLEPPPSFVNGRYVVRRFLGEGGKKRVFLAHDSLLDRDVAFALIKTDGLDEAGRQRITREAQAMGRLGSHPNIVSIFDLGEEPIADDAGPLTRSRDFPVSAALRPQTQPYVVTELMAGGDVEGLIEKAEGHKLSLERAIEIASETCAGLEFAHAKGIIHRDLKPGNVWLTAPSETAGSFSSSTPSPRSGGGGRGEGAHSHQVAKIGDFGLAVAIDRSRLTQAGMMVGTVNYMPPEQAMGGAISPQSDLYSLGAMLYEMVCGRPPFVGDESVAIIGQHLNTPPVAPTWHRHDCPPALEALILRLLEKDPSRRPGSAGEVRAMLASIASAPHPNPLPGGEGARITSLPQSNAANGASSSPLSLMKGEGEGEGSSAPAADPGTDNPLYRTTFVGRQAEVKTLQGALDAALSGNGGLVMVAGEPGIGKTALCEQLVTYANLRGAKALVGHCYEEGSLSLPYLAFVEAIRSYVLAREPDGLRSDMGSGASEIARIVTEVRDRVSVEVRAPGDPEDDRWRLLQAVSSFLRNASTVQPIVVLLEDLHWADRGTLDLLLHVARNLQGARLLIVGNYRDVEVDRAHPLANVLADLRRITGFQRIPLRGLTVDEVARMMSNIRGQEANYSRAEAIHRQTEGNPLFIQEVLRYLVEEGVTIRQDGRYVAANPDTYESSIPEGLREVVGKRLSHLSEKSNQVLTIAAVIGRDFRLDVLQKLAGLTEEDLYAALEEASARAIIEQRQSPSGLTFRFTHAFFRQTLYEEIFVPRRIRVHQQVGKALEELYGTRLDDHAAELAEHYAQSTETADLEKAVKYSELCAEHCMTVFAYGEAVRLLEQALRAQEVLDPDDKAKRCDLLLALGSALISYGEWGRVSQDVGPVAFSLAEGLNDGRRACAAALLVLDSLRRLGGASITGDPDFRKWAMAAHGYAIPGTKEGVQADVFLAWVEQIGDHEFEAAWERRRSALARARNLGENATLFLAAVEFVTNLTSPPLERLSVAEEFSSRSPAGVPSRTQFDLLSSCGYTFLGFGDRERAESLWRAADESMAKAQREGEVTIEVLRRDALLAMTDGRLMEATGYGHRMLEVAHGRSLDMLAGQYTSTLRRAWLYMGLIAEARDSVDTWIRFAQGETLTRALRCRALCDAFAGDLDGARTLLLGHLKNPDDLRAICSTLDPLEIAVVTRSVDCLDALMSGCAEWCLPVDITDRTTLARLLGAASALLGRPEEARDYYNQALEVCAKIRFRPEIALTRLGLAELLLDHYPDEHATAIEHLDFAIAEFREMKMQPSLERALSHRGLLKA